MASQMDLKSTMRSRRQSRGDPSRSTTTIHRCYTSPCDSRSDLGTTSEVVFTNNSPPMLSSALVDDSLPLPSSMTRRRCPRRPSPTSFADVPRRRLIVTARWPSPTSFVDVPRCRLVVTARRPSPTSFTDVSRRRLVVTARQPSLTSFVDGPRRCFVVITRRPSPTSLVVVELQASCPCRQPDNAIRRRPDILSKAKSRFNIFLNILQSLYIAIIFLRAVFSIFALQMIFRTPKQSC